MVVSAARYWDGDSEELSGPVEIIVDEALMVEVGRNLHPPPGSSRVDLEEHTLLPGLMDVHVHTATQSSSGLTSQNTAVSRRVLGALPALRTLLHNGFTTVRDLGCDIEEPVTVALRDAVAEGVVPGPSMVVAPHVISSRAGHGDESSSISAGRALEAGALADGPESVLTRVRSEIRAGADWIKFAASGGFNSPTDDPEDVTYTQQEMDALVSAATDFRIFCAAHAFGDESVRRAVRAGVRSVEHALLASDETLDAMERNGVFLVPTQYALGQYLAHLDDDDYWSGRPDYLREKLYRYAAQMTDTARRMVRSDVQIAFGSDAGMFPHNENWREFSALVANGISPHRALRAATSVAADLLALPDRGRIRPGARADLVAVPGNPFDDIEVMGHVGFVMHRGRVVRRP